MDLREPVLRSSGGLPHEISGVALTSRSTTAAEGR
jgi:hypothetical protein